MRRILAYIPMLISFGALADLPPDEAEIASAAMTVAATSEDATPELPLHILERSSFPLHPFAIEQLRVAAAQGYCDMDAASSIELLDQLIAKNSGTIQWSREVGDTRIALVSAPQGDADYVAISIPVIGRDRRSALIGMDISDASGVLTLLRRVGGKWSVVDECAEWTSWK